MLSLSAVLASLPPVSLAETDLARFIAQAIGRRARGELPGLASLFSEEQLRGYPPSLGAILATACEVLLADQIDPQTLDARACDALLGGRAFLDRLAQRVEVRRQRLRPGTVVTGELRQTLGMRLLVLPGRGRELMLVGPVDLAQVPDARFAMPQGVVLVRPGTPEEAELLRATWAAIEEAFGLAGPDAERWEARFLALARLENHDAEAAKAGLVPLSPELRRRLWDALVQHLRDGELPEQHRPGRRGLERRLSQLGIEADLPWVEATLGLAESVYRAAGLDPEVMAGRCPCPREDLERWAQWVDVPAAQRQRLKDLEPTQVELLLLRLSEEEAGRAEGLVEESLRRPLASLRDGCLRPRWQRARLALSGVDPLVLAEQAIANGEDLGAQRARLTALAKEAREATQAADRADRVALSRSSRRPEPVAAPSGLAAPSGPSGPAAPTGPAAPGEPLAEPETSTPTLVSGPTAPIRPPESATTASPSAPGQPPPTAAPTPPKGQPTVGPPRFHLPPMPEVPPPRPAPRVRPRTDFPPMPAVPSAARPRPPSEVRSPAEVRPPRAPSQARPLPARPTTRGPQPAPATFTSSLAEPLAGSAHDSAPILPTPRPAPTEGPAIRPARAEAVARARPAAVPAARSRLQTTPHLVTPAQGNEFYDASFRELELLERDLLQRGPFAGASDRVDAIAREAHELHLALGPSARSGDREFQAAQRRIEKVQEYLDRIRPLLEGQGPPPAPRSGGLLGRLFGKKKG